MADDNGQEQGLTLVECLVALILIAFVAGSVTPALVIAVATRVQSQKAEQAIEVAQAEINAIRTTLERGNYTLDDLPASVTTLTSETDTATYTGPTAGSLAASTATYSTVGTTTARAVDIDGDGDNDFGIQIFRTPGQLNNSDLPIAFTVGVRVYDAVAIQNGGAGTLDIDEARIGTTGGEGERGRLPLATVYTTVASADTSESYCGYYEFTSSSPSASAPVDLDCN
ncbi:MAG: type II secretion system protein [Cyanobacteria bacterium P01_H01_bin.119]